MKSEGVKSEGVKSEGVKSEGVKSEGVKNRIIILGLTIALCMGAVGVSAKSKPVVKRVYMFGFSASFTDSLACLTSVQQLDSAWVDPSHGFLMDRALYSLQLQYYVESTKGISNNTCAVFYAKSRRKAERLYNKIRQRYVGNEDVKLRELPEEEFRFKAENYIENAPVQVEETK